MVVNHIPYVIQNFAGAKTNDEGRKGLVPAPSSGKTEQYLCSDGTWKDTQKLYTATGSNTDGSMTQKAITAALGGKASSSHTHKYAGSDTAGGTANDSKKLRGVYKLYAPENTTLYDDTTSDYKNTNYELVKVTPSDLSHKGGKTQLPLEIEFFRQNDNFGDPSNLHENYECYEDCKMGLDGSDTVLDWIGYEPLTFSAPYELGYSAGATNGHRKSLLLKAGVIGALTNDGGDDNVLVFNGKRIFGENTNSAYTELHLNCNKYEYYAQTIISGLLRVYKEADGVDAAYPYCVVPAATHSTETKLGSPTQKWGIIYASSGTIQTSDRNEKNSIEELGEKSEQLFFKLKPSSYKFNNGTSDRTHYGFISQDIEDSMTELGMTAKDFAGFCKDQKVEITEDEETGEEVSKKIEGEYMYSLRYDEFIALNTHMIQKLYAKLDEKDEEIKKLQSSLTALEERMTALEDMMKK